MSRTADHAEHALPMTPAIRFPAAVTRFRNHEAPATSGQLPGLLRLLLRAGGQRERQSRANRTRVGESPAAQQVDQRALELSRALAGSTPRCVHRQRSQDRARISGFQRYRSCRRV